MDGAKGRARKTVCGAKQGFRNKEGGPTTECDGCKDQPPKCTLYPYSPNCCKPKTPHHVIPKHCFSPASAELKAGSKLTEVAGKDSVLRYEGCELYNPNKAPCICVSGSDKSDSSCGSLKEHGKIHNKFDHAEDNAHPKSMTWTYSEARNAAVQSIVETFPECEERCIEAQLDDYHKNQCGIKADTKLRAKSTGGGKQPDIPASVVQYGDGY